MKENTAGYLYLAKALPINAVYIGYSKNPEKDMNNLFSMEMPFGLYLHHKIPCDDMENNVQLLYRFYFIAAGGHGYTKQSKTYWFKNKLNALVSTYSIVEIKNSEFIFKEGTQSWIKDYGQWAEDENNVTI